MGKDFLRDLLQALERVVTPDAVLFRDILIINGMPEETEPLRYLGFKSHVFEKDNRSLELVAVINNRMAKQWRLKGYRKTLNPIGGCARWTRNPVDLFLDTLRSSPEMIDILAAAPGRYTLFGILTVEPFPGAGRIKRLFRCLRPVVALPGIGADDLKRVAVFETQNEIRKIHVKGL
jgi:hypothetical protein